MRRILAPFLLALLLVAAPLAGAQSSTPPAGAFQQDLGGGVRMALWVGPSNATANEEARPGDETRLWFAAYAPDANATDLATYFNVTSDDLALANASVVVPGPAGASWVEGSIPVTIPANFTGTQARYNFTFTMRHEPANGTSEDRAFYRGESVVPIAQVVAPAPAPTIDTPVLVGGGLLLLLVLGFGVYGLRQRREKAVMNRAPRRSQALREEALEKAAEKRPEEVVQIQQEIRQEEKVREKRRELQILEAKRADALKTLDLLKKRHEAGGLTKLQYDNMVAKKQADLQRIEAEIAEMERQDSGAAA